MGGKIPGKISLKLSALNSQSVLNTQELSKYYGKRRGIVDINLDVKGGEVFGYLGPNGAGKTTTIRTLLGLLKPSGGTATVLGHDIVKESLELRRKIGYLPGELNTYQNMTGADYLRYLANLRGGVDWDFAMQLAERLNCETAPRMSSLSHGNRQKLGLVQAFMARPELLILDEPTIGLDPLMQQEFYHMVAEVRADGRTVFLSSHIMPEVERVCDRVAIIREGVIVTTEEISTIKSRVLRKMEIHFAEDVPAECYTNIEGVRDVVVSGNVLSCTVVGELDALIKAAAQAHVVNIISQEPSLEEVFLTYYQGDNDAV